MGNVARKGYENANKVMIGNSEVKRPLRRRRWIMILKWVLRK